MRSFILKYYNSRSWKILIFVYLASACLLILFTNVVPFAISLMIPRGRYAPHASNLKNFREENIDFFSELALHSKHRKGINDTILWTFNQFDKYRDSIAYIDFFNAQRGSVSPIKLDHPQSTKEDQPDQTFYKQQSDHLDKSSFTLAESPRLSTYAKNHLDILIPVLILLLLCIYYLLKDGTFKKLFVLIKGGKRQDIIPAENNVVECDESIAISQPPIPAVNQKIIASFLLKYFSFAMILMIVVLITQPWVHFLRKSLVISFVITLFILQFSLRANTIKKHSWKRVSELWLKLSGIPAFSVGGYGFVAKTKVLDDKVFSIAASNPDVNMHFLTGVYVVCLLLIVISMILVQVWRSNTSDDSNEPMLWFIPTFLLSWLCNLGLYTLLFDSIALTFHAHFFA